MRINYARCQMVGTGYYARIAVFPVRRVSKKRGAKRLPTSEVQARLNLKNSERKLADLIHLNYTPDDDEVGFDYRNGTMPHSVEEARGDMRKFIRKYRVIWSRLTGRPKSEFKYVVVTECSKKGRFHHHCVFTGGVDARVIGKLWTAGRTTVDYLKFDENGLRGLSHYITKSRLAYRRWMASRNLKKPAPKQSDYRLTYKELRYINEHPEDAGFIESRFPGWKVSPMGIMTEKIKREIADGETGEAKTEAMPYAEVLLYREDCPYYERLADGGILYKFGLGAEFRIPDFGFSERGEEAV